MSSNFQTSSEDSSANSIESSQNDVSPSASEDRGPTDSIPRSGLETPMALARLSGSNSQLPNFQPHQLAALFHLSLIEGRCRTQAAIALNAGRRLDDHLPENHPEVHRLAKHLFSEMTKELHKAGILPDEFAGQELSELRRNYLSSFDAILHNIASQRTHGFQDNTYSSLFDRSKAYAIGGELLSTSLIDKRAFVLQQYTMAPQNHIPSLPALSFKAIYKTDYKEICLLGKGGFGEVYKAHHFLDGVDYAVKKVVLRTDMIGDGDLEGKAREFLSELRTLARLEHTNIVRYKTSWAETRPSELPGDPSDSDELEELDTSVTVDEKDEESFRWGEGSKRIEIVKPRVKFEHLDREARHVRRMSRTIDESRDGIVFGHSVSSAGGRNKPNKEKKALVKVEKSGFFHGANSPNDTDSDDSDEDIDGEASTEKVGGGGSTEEIWRAGEQGAIQNSLAGLDVVLFIQMSCHPMNLDDYLWPDQQERDQNPPIEHCYHSLPTARILLAILDGVEYIHGKKIVHRDLKPSNIMLSLSEDPTSIRNGAIKVSDCPDCHGRGCNELYITPHIGDFGLVADIKDPESDNSLALAPPTTSNTNDKLIQAPAFSGMSSRMPGTRFYCAPKEPRGKSVICPKVDVYSLGVIALELAYRFGTKTERNIELEGLKDGKFPSGFECHEMAEGIKNMLRKEREERWGCAQVRRWLERLIKKIEGEMPAKETVEMGETEDTKDDEKTSRQEIGNGEDMKKVEETKQADKV